MRIRPHTQFIMSLYKNILLIFLVIANFSMPFYEVALADPLNSLRNAIRGREQDLNSVDSEIKALQEQVQVKSSERKTLQQTVSELSSRQNELLSRISSAENSIGSIEKSIKEINIEINMLEENIGSRKEALGANLQRINVYDGDSLIEGLLKFESLAEYWQQADTSQQLGAALGESMNKIREAKSELDAQKSVQQREKESLLSLQQSILINKTSVDIARSEQDRLLGITRNEEANYQSILDEKRDLRRAFESDLAAYESQLNIALNPADIPTPVSSTLSWPVTNVIITQYFGNTAFAQSGAYNGNGHNGIDLGIPIGTPILAAQDGVIKGIGNTDAQCPNASYGKWILVEHPNGLSTMYAHLSQHAVSTGQSVKRGEVIGYGGNTGYSTGPHLHFTVFASQGVRISGLPSRSCPGTTITMPLADLSAYLNPIQYLP